MQLFYINAIQDNITLDQQESKHITKVLRKKKGDIVNLTNAKGNLYKAKIINSHIKKCQLEIIGKEEQKKQHNYYSHIAIAPTKNIDRFEWFLEKSTEIGIDEITPIICKHSERKTIKKERSHKILLSAMKQSVKFHVPKLNDIIDFNTFTEQTIRSNKYIAHCQGDNNLELRNIKDIKKTLIVIGPEGDFSNKEIELALKNNFKSVNLGSSRLRTETAAIVALNTINIRN